MKHWKPLLTHPATIAAALLVFVPLGVCLLLLNPVLRRDRRWWAGAALCVFVFWIILPAVRSFSESAPTVLPKADKQTVQDVLEKYKDAVELYADTNDILDIRKVVVRGQLMGADLVWLEKIPGVEHLKFETNAIRSWEYLRNLRHLKILDARDAIVPVSTIESLAKMAPELSALAVRCTGDASGDSYIDALSRMPKLKALKLNQLTPPAGRSFRELPGLEALRIDNVKGSLSTQALVNSCANHQELRFIALLGGLYFGRGPRVVTCEPFATCPKLAWLMMSGNDDIKELSIVQSIVAVTSLQGLWCKLSPAVEDQARILLQKNLPGAYKGPPYSSDNNPPTWEEFCPAEQAPLRRVVVAPNGDLFFAN